LANEIVVILEKDRLLKRVGKSVTWVKHVNNDDFGYFVLSKEMIIWNYNVLEQAYS